MIAGHFHLGSGLGNQLHRYVMTRVLAADKEFGWGMIEPYLFKGFSFMNLNFGIQINPHELPKFFPRGTFQEKKVVENGVDIRGYDPEINFVKEFTIIDGEFQDIRYFGHRMDDIAEWLKVDRIGVGDDTCIIGFRGGEYSIYPDLFLTQEYWQTAMEKMLAINPNMEFHVVTDDVPLAKQWFPNFTVTHEMGMDWRKVRFAKHAIIANSSFYILPRLLAHHEKEAVTIAPRYWARHNTKVWALPQNYYPQFMYL